MKKLIISMSLLVSSLAIISCTKQSSANKAEMKPVITKIKSDDALLSELCDSTANMFAMTNLTIR